MKKTLYNKANLIYMTEETLDQLKNDHLGICLTCGSTTDNCEPNTKMETCGDCEQNTVCAPNVLGSIGMIVLVDDDNHALNFEL